MIRVVEAVVDEKSRVRLLAKVALPEARRALVTILEEDPKVVACEAAWLRACRRPKPAGRGGGG